MGKLTSYEELQEKLSRLNLMRIGQRVDQYCQKALDEKLSYSEFLAQLVDEEIAHKREHTLRFRIQMAQFPFKKTIEQFDFSYQPSIDKRKIEELATLRFVANGENIIFLGPPGVGKTQLAIGLGIRACMEGMKTYFITGDKVIHKLIASLSDNSFEQKMRSFKQPHLLIIDELGYLAFNQQASNFFFQLICSRYEKGSIIITSNRSYSEWDKIFSEPVIASAILDRLLHHSITINIRGESYRLKEKRMFFEKTNYNVAKNEIF